MRMTKRNLLLIVAVAAVAAGAHLATVAVGQDGPGGRGPRHDSVIVRWLGLTGETAEAVAAEDSTFRRDSRQLQRDVQIEQLKLATMFESDEATEADLRAQFDKLAAAHMAMHQRVADHVLAIRPHLDADQRARLNEFMARKIRGGRGGPGGQEGPGGPDQQPGPGGMQGPEGHRPLRREGAQRPGGMRRPFPPDHDGPPPIGEGPESNE